MRTMALCVAVCGDVRRCAHALSVCGIACMQMHLHVTVREDVGSSVGAGVGLGVAAEEQPGIMSSCGYVLMHAHTHACIVCSCFVVRGVALH